MKRFIICVCCLLVPICHSFAQISLSELLNGRAVDNTAVSELTINAIKSEVVLIRQQYRLERNGKTYGKNNMPFYGETYSLGIKISNGMIVSNSVIEPWKTDEDYIRLNSSGQYQPELFWTYQRALDGTEYCDVDLEFGTEYLHPSDINSCLFVHEDGYGEFGLEIDDLAGEKSGFMIWVKTLTTPQDSTMKVSIQSNPMKVTASLDSAYVVMNPSDSDKVLGGLYVVPKFERGGRIQLLLVGVAVQCDDSGKWSLALLTRENIRKEDDTVPEKSDNDVLLEPTLIEESEPVVIEEKKKKK